MLEAAKPFCIAIYDIHVLRKTIM